MKKIILLAFFVTGNLIVNAQIYKSKSTFINFFSTTPVEDIKADNKAATSILNTATGDIVFRIPIKAFAFKDALMEEHFNENYMETSKYEYSTFKGKVNEKIDVTKDGVYPVTATGTINIHGVDKQETLKGTLTVKGGELALDSKFKIALKDYNIEVPKLVYKKIAEIIDVTVNAVYTEYKK